MSSWGVDTGLVDNDPAKALLASLVAATDDVVVTVVAEKLQNADGPLGVRAAQEAVAAAVVVAVACGEDPDDYGWGVWSWVPPAGAGKPLAAMAERAVNATLSDECDLLDQWDEEDAAMYLGNVVPLIEALRAWAH